MASITSRTRGQIGQQAPIERPFNATTHSDMVEGTCPRCGRTVYTNGHAWHENTTAHMPEHDDCAAVAAAIAAWASEDGEDD